MFKNILIATDGCELSDKTARNGVVLAKTLNAKVTGVYVVPAHVAVAYGEMAWVDDRLGAQMREFARADGNKFLDRIQAAAHAAGVSFERVVFESDQVWKGILDIAQQQGCDLIVMAAHGRHGLVALLLGSETNKVLTHAKIPVLIYH